MDQDDLPCYTESTNFKETTSNIDSYKWLEAMKSKMDDIKVNKVQTLVNSFKKIKPIGCNWVFKRKTNIDGNVQMCKARLMAKDYSQVEGIDHEETFSLVAIIKSIWIMLIVALYHYYDILQIDVRIAFFNINL